MKKAIIFCTALIMMVGLLSVSGYCQEGIEYLDNTIFDNPRRMPAVFVHDDHNEKAGLDDCTECHHIYDENGQKDEYESSEDQMCADCHEIEDEGRKPGLMKAYHLNCKGCHLVEGKGPFVCGQCHVNA